MEAFADDYAFVIQGLIDFYEATFEGEWLSFALELQDTQDRLFWDAQGGGYFSTGGRDKNLVLRMKDENDGAEPAASSVSALNLLRLGEMCDRDDFRVRGAQTIDAFAPILTRFPNAMPQMLAALDFRESPKRQIVIAGRKDGDDTRQLRAEVHRHFLPHKVLLLADQSDGISKSEAVRAMTPISGKAAAYVCQDFTCQAPVTEAEESTRSHCKESVTEFAGAAQSAGRDSVEPNVCCRRCTATAGGSLRSPKIRRRAKRSAQVSLALAVPAVLLARFRFR